MHELAYDVRVIWAMARKDIQSSLTERAFTVMGVLIPLNFLILFLLLAISGGEAPIAVVLDEHGPYALQFVSAMQQAHSFIIQETTAAQAQNLMRQGEIVAIVTIPANFDATVQAHQRVGLPVVVNNLDVDFTNDIRRAVPLAITSFYAHAFPHQVVVYAQEEDTYVHDTGYVQYLAVSLVVVGVLLGGLLQAGTNAAREYERGTIQELMLAPAHRWAIQMGKMLGALVLNALGVIVGLLVVILLLGIYPVHWGAVLGFTLVLMLLFVALGAFIGTLIRRQQPFIPLSLGLAIPVFFISGPLGPANWGSPVIATIAQWQPVYYGVAAFQYAFHNFVTTPSGPLTDSFILVGSAIIAVTIGTIALSKKGAALS